MCSPQIHIILELSAMDDDEVKRRKVTVRTIKHYEYRAFILFKLFLYALSFL